MDTSPDYGEYTLSELAQAMRSIDQRKHPERFELLKTEYARRQEVSEGTALVPSAPQRPIMVLITMILGLIAIPVVLAALIIWLGMALLLSGWKPN